QALVEIHGRRIALDEFGNRFREPGGPGLRLVGELVLIGGGSLCHDGRNYRASRGGGRRRRGFPGGGSPDPPTCRIIHRWFQELRARRGPMPLEWEELVTQLDTHLP